MRRMLWFAVVIALAAPALFAADQNEELLAASRNGDLAAVKQLVEKGAAIESKTPYGQTPLYLAAMNGHEGVVRFLIDKGASAEVRDTFYKAPILEFVLMRKHYGVAKMLLTKTSATPDPVLREVAATGKADLVQTFLENSKPGQAALDRAYENALEQKHAEVAAVLKKAGAREPAPVVEADPKVLETYTGTYKAEGIPLDIKVSVKDGKLYMQASGQSEFPLKARSSTRFEFQQAGMNVEFSSAASFTLRQGAGEYKFKKVVAQ